MLKKLIHERKAGELRRGVERVTASICEYMFVVRCSIQVIEDVTLFRRTHTPFQVLIKVLCPFGWSWLGHFWCEPKRITDLSLRITSHTPLFSWSAPPCTSAWVLEWGFHGSLGLRPNDSIHPGVSGTWAYAHHFLHPASGITHPIAH